MMNERGLTSADWTVYNNGTKRSRYNTVPTSNITAETVTADGLTVITCRTGHHALRHITWESPRKIGEGLDKRRSSFAPQGRAVNEVPASHPTQPVATRPLAIRKDGTWYAYGWDLTKNICEVFGQHGYLRTSYTYTPYGEVTATGDVTQPIQWSSEYNDAELALVYYNYRHYNPIAGRWLGRDCLLEFGCINLYKYAINNPHFRVVILGMKVDSHHTERCNGDDDCDKLKEGLDAWNKHYEKRYRELQEDQYNYKTTNIKNIIIILKDWMQQERIYNIALN